MSGVEVLERTEALVNAWCARRCLGALREVLAGYPLTNAVTDGWGDLRQALLDVRAFALGELTSDEALEVERLIAEVDRLLTGRLG